MSGTVRMNVTDEQARQTLRDLYDHDEDIFEMTLKVPTAAAIREFERRFPAIAAAEKTPQNDE